MKLPEYLEKKAGKALNLLQEFYAKVEMQKQLENLILNIMVLKAALLKQL